jgi:hypothetical protein
LEQRFVKKKAENIEVARAVLADKIDIDTIAKFINLSINEIKKLNQHNCSFSCGLK